ncbi:MAG: HAD hydrolase-like protein [Humibacillus sp.]|nr:HAD hydrolase-like protein [Humibacillus sp.]MDN5779340.1 HAD hydrolase-like protein [Humibacillus sp.]
MDNDRARPDHSLSPEAPRRPLVLIFDVNEALSNLAPLGARFEDVGAPAHLATTWFAGKPAAGAYAYALEQCGVAPREAMLVAVHSWDIDGAARAGLRAAWVSRDGGPYPGYFTTLDLRAESLTDLATALR